VLTLSPGVAPAGEVVVVIGNGVPAGIPVVVRWDASIGSVLVKSTGRPGHFLAQLPIVPHDRLGRREAVAVGFPTTVAPLLVVPSAIQPGGSNVAIFYHN
jgi:hypothetical protein